MAGVHFDGPAGAQWSAMRDAFAGMTTGRLPPHLLFSERDFDENDYEALLALDDSVESRKGATTAARKLSSVKWRDSVACALSARLLCGGIHT